jgi:hypothetical protein
MLNEKVRLRKPDGRVFDGVKALLTKDIVLIDDTKLPIEEGDAIERTLPSGVVETLVVIEPGFFAGIHGMPAHYQVRVRKGTAPASQHGSIVYNVTGPNARLNIQSADSSTNVVSLAPTELFEQMVTAVRDGVELASDRDVLIDRIRELEAAGAGGAFLSAYQRLIATAADHIAVFGPFLPALGQLASR